MADKHTSARTGFPLFFFSFSSIYFFYFFACLHNSFLSEDIVQWMCVLTLATAAAAVKQESLTAVANERARVEAEVGGFKFCAIQIIWITANGLLLFALHATKTVNLSIYPCGASVCWSEQQAVYTWFLRCSLFFSCAHFISFRM